tara:strand:- start:418 stop:690 length:273 start_codon:yes stop_codon:yes gene_type:complete
MSLDTIIRIEQAMGMSILKIGQKLASAEITLLEVINILTLAIRSGGSDIKENDVKILVSDMGLLEAIKMTGELVAMALNVDDESSAEKKT